MLPQDPSPARPRPTSNLQPRREGWLDSLNPETRIRAEQALARVNKYIERNEIELDDDSHALLKLIVEDGVNADPTKILDKNWAIRTALRRMNDPKLDGKTSQRCFEFACELLGHVETGKGKNAQVAQIAFDALQKDK